jgi:trimethylamine--corrinoid protein Co-methyltransferase
MIKNWGKGPEYRVLSDKKKEEIYLAALEVLRRTGLKVKVPEALELLRKAGCWVDGDRVRIPAHLIDWAIRAAPRRITLCDRDGTPAMYLEDGKSYFGTGGDCPTVIDPYTGERRQGMLQDVVDFARVADALPNIDFVLNMSIAQDVDQSVSDLYHFEAMVNNTKKPILYSAWNVETLKATVEMCEVISGGAEAFRRSPFAILFGANVSPLQITQEYTPMALYIAEKGLPLVCAPSEIAGGTAPVTLAGAMVQGQAEMLAMLLIVQLKREGTPFIFSVCGPIPMDMSTMTASYASPEFALTMGSMAEMAQYHGIPTFGFAGCSDSKCFDEQASMEGALTMLISALSGGNLIHDVGYIESGLTSSFEMLVVMDEMAGYVKRLMGGIEVNPETLALDVIDRVGPSGEYLSDEHTYDHFRENWMPGLLDRNTYSTWCEQGKLTLRQRANKKVLELLEIYQTEPLVEDIKTKLSEIVAREEKKANQT